MHNEQKSDLPLPPPPPDARKFPPPEVSGTCQVPHLSWNLNGLWVFVPLVVLAIRLYAYYSSPPSEHAKPPQKSSQASARQRPEAGPNHRRPNEDDHISQPDARDFYQSPYSHRFLLDEDDQTTPEPESGPRYEEDRRLWGESKRRGRVRFDWSEATRELLPLVSRLSAQERTALGIAVAASGFDIYGARVTLTNTGQTSVKVSPQNLQIHFGTEAATVFVTDDPRFLRPTVLRPGQSASGLVMFEARVDIGAAIRLGEGQMSYVDPHLEVVD